MAEPRFFCVKTVGGAHKEIGKTRLGQGFYASFPRGPRFFIKFCAYGNFKLDLSGGLLWMEKKTFNEEKIKG